MTEAMASDADKKALEAFLLDNPELTKLEALLDEFNIFEAIGAVRQEVRHSDFLAFLLNPQERHRLGTTFVQQFLQATLRLAEGDGPVTPVDLSLGEFDDLQVFREWQFIDILLLDETNRLAVIIENKVGSSEHSQQLQRYWRLVQQRFPGFSILGLFLTPDGREPTDERYLPIDYALIHNLINELTATRSSTMGADVTILLHHYGQMLRRHIMPDSDIAQLAQRIYKKHHRALDLIFEHRPDLQADLRSFLENMIAETPGMILEDSTKTYIRCCPDAWETPLLRRGNGWVSSNRMLLLEFVNSPGRLFVKVTIGPGPQPLRKQLVELAVANVPPFSISERRAASIQGSYKTIYSYDILNANDYEGTTLEDLTPKVQRKWENFVENALPKLTAVLQAANWLWVDEVRGEVK